MLVQFLFLITAGFVTSADDIIELACDINQCTGARDVEPGDEISITACENHIVRIDVTAATVPEDGQNCPLSLVDPTVESYEHIYFYRNEAEWSETLYSSKNKVLVRTNVTQCSLSLSVSCVPNVHTSYEEEYTSGSRGVDLFPNSVNTFEFNSENIHQIKVNYTHSSPLAGYSLLTIGDESYMVFGSFESAKVKPREAVSKLDIFTFNQKGLVGEVFWDLGVQTTTSTTTSTTTVTTTPKMEKAVMFVLGVNEEEFVRNSLEDIGNRAWEIMKGACRLDNTDINQVRLGDPVSCRSKCLMTDDKDRGCVQVDIDVSKIPASSCDLGPFTAVQFVREKLEAEQTELAIQFSAYKVQLESCTKIEFTSSWLLVTVALTAGSILLAVGLLLLVSSRRFNFATRNKQQEKSTEASKNLGRDDHWEIS